VQAKDKDLELVSRNADIQQPDKDNRNQYRGVCHQFLSCPQVQDQDDRREHENIPKGIQSRPCHAFSLRFSRDKAIEDVAEPTKQVNPDKNTGVVSKRDQQH